MAKSYDWGSSRSLARNSVLLAFCVFVFAACSSSSSSSRDPITPEPSLPNIVEVAVADSRFGTLVTALQATGLDSVLADTSQTYTVFAPTNDAFAALGDTLTALLQDTEALSNILLYHVFPGAAVNAATATSLAGTTIDMANGDAASLSLQAGNLFINGAQIIVTNVQASNGIIHAIDAVILPPEPTPAIGNIVETAMANPEFSTLVSAVAEAGLVNTLADASQQFTVFAPTNAAFEKIDPAALQALLADTEALINLLTYHVYDGAVSSVAAMALAGQSITMINGDTAAITLQSGKLYINDAEIIITDVLATNGVIHAIDTVIMPPVTGPQADTLVEVASANPDFSILVDAVVAAGLADTLADPETSLTVFAPTNAAFVELLEELEISAETLLADTETLTQILLYHVVGAEVLADAAIAKASSEDPFVTMVNEGDTVLSLRGGDLFINLSKVVSPNVMASNGVIHVIDKVIVPPTAKGSPTLNIVETAIAAGSFTTLVELVQAAGLDGALADPEASLTVFAPTDAAFALIDNATLEALAGDIPTLTQVLLHHVVDGEVNSLTAFSLNGKQAPSLAEDLNLSIEIVDGVLQIEGSNVVTFDIYTTNGVIHVIDTVITSSLQ